MTQLSETLEIFKEIYRENRWGGYGDSVSGPGSSRAATARLREALPGVLRALEVSSMVDVPCGDLRWMRPAELPLERYVGMDIVPELVEEAREASGGVGEFRVADVVTDPLPEVDLIFCRDCLVHLSDELALAALRNIRASGSRYLMTTTFYAVNHNLDRETGDWRPLNLQMPPYSLPAPMLIVPEGLRPAPELFFDKSMGVWELPGLSVAGDIP